MVTSLRRCAPLTLPHGNDMATGGTPAAVPLVIRFNYKNFEQNAGGTNKRSTHCKVCNIKIKDAGATTSNFIRHLKTHPESAVSLIRYVTILTQHFLRLSSVSARSCPGVLTASFGQCPSLFASPPHFGNPGIAGNYWWMRTHLVQWDAGNPECLLQLVKELIQQYHHYQCQRLRESSRLLFEYDSLLEDPNYGRNMEIYAGRKNSWTGEFSARFLLKLPVDFSNIPVYLLK
ncbi:uncharacterized protein, partial [Notothenia coriiceps]|uniref:BRISC and BRCA1-A complex member 2 n=1 Tax=Notothenia coriiceps TaxID=8208 RepID=A0A6I9Q6W4_9TELE